MNQKKKQIRKEFRAAVFERDGFCCVGCGFKSTPEKVNDELDAHHIVDRNLMSNGGYVKENGVSLCGECHVLAEMHHNGQESEGFSPKELYEKINSSYELAVKYSEIKQSN